MGSLLASRCEATIPPPPPPHSFLRATSSTFTSRGRRYAFLEQQVNAVPPVAGSKSPSPPVVASPAAAASEAAACAASISTSPPLVPPPAAPTPALSLRDASATPAGLAAALATLLGSAPAAALFLERALTAAQKDAELPSDESFLEVAPSAPPVAPPPQEMSTEIAPLPEPSASAQVLAAQVALAEEVAATSVAAALAEAALAPHQPRVRADAPPPPPRRTFSPERLECLGAVVVDGTVVIQKSAVAPTAIAQSTHVALLEQSLLDDDTTPLAIGRLPALPSRRAPPPPPRRSSHEDSPATSLQPPSPPPRKSSPRQQAPATATAIVAVAAAGADYAAIVSMETPLVPVNGFVLDNFPPLPGLDEAGSRIGLRLVAVDETDRPERTHLNGGLVLTKAALVIATVAGANDEHAVGIREALELLSLTDGLSNKVTAQINTEASCAREEAALAGDDATALEVELELFAQAHPHLDAAFTQLDANRNGEISRTEIIRATRRDPTVRDQSGAQSTTCRPVHTGILTWRGCVRLAGA